MAAIKKKKRFFEVPINLINKDVQLQAFEIEELENKYIQYDLTRILRGKGSLLQGIVKIKDGTAEIIPTKFTILPYYIKRMVRKGTNYIEDSFETKTKNSIVRIKPFLVTRRKVSRSVRKALRNKCREEIINECEKYTTNEIFEEILKNNLQRKLSLILKKIYPLSLCEIRIIQKKSEIENIQSEEPVLEKPAQAKEKEAVKTTKKKKSEKTE
jgi:ribosomal protein S3AE